MNLEHRYQTLCEQEAARHGVACDIHAEDFIFRFIVDQALDKDGFAFTPTSEQKDLDPSEYGLTITSAEFVLNHVFAIPGFSLRLFQEGLWWQHQDVYILRRAKP